MPRKGDDPVDLSGVLPQRRETVRRRIAALEEYERLPRRTTTEASRLAEAIGLSPPSFYRLWRSWRTLRDPSALQGVTRAEGMRDPAGDREYVRRLLASLPDDQSIERQVLGVEKAAALAGVPVRSRSALRRLVREIRGKDEPMPLSACPDDLIGLDAAPIELVVHEEGLTTLPMATALVHLRTNTVLSIHLSLGPPSPVALAAALSRWLAEVPVDCDGTRIEGVVAPSARGYDWTELWKTLRRRGLERTGPDGARVPAGDVIVAALGRRIMGVEFRPRMVHRAPKERRPLVRSGRLNRPLPLAEAQAVMDQRVLSRSRPTLYFPKARMLACDLRTSFGPF